MFLFTVIPAYQCGQTALAFPSTEEIKKLLRNAPSVADRKKLAAAAAAQKMADDAAAAAAQKLADDAIKVQPSLPYCFFVHIIDNDITYLNYFQFFRLSQNARML